MRNVLSCFYPTTVVLVDDDPEILRRLEDILKVVNVICKSFTNPKKALDYINDANYNKLSSLGIVESGEWETSDWKTTRLNIFKIHREVYNPSRFSKISAVVSDYYMPEMNGPDFCAELLNRNIQRIMLTGKATNSQAVDEFNKNNITRFVRKDSEIFKDEILKGVTDAVYKYFRLYTDEISKFLAGESYHLNDNAFSSFVFPKLSDSRFIEYYMIDPFGGYLLLDSDGNVGILSATTEQEFANLINVAIESEASEEVIEKLKSHQYMLVSHSKTGEYPPVEQWHKYLRPAQHSDIGECNYYFFLDESGKDVKLDVDFDKIVSYNTFKSQQ